MFEEFVEKYKLPSYRLNQINKHFYQEPHTSFEEFESLPFPIREKLNSEFSYISIKAKDVIKGKNVTKALFLKKGSKVPFETVLIKNSDKRNTLCVSSMIGCPLGCRFCATGRMGFVDYLTDREIIDQVLFFQRQLQKNNQNIDNVVFMGMGEPLLNLENVVKAYEVMTSPEKIGLGKRKITISTVGIIDQIEKLKNSTFKGKLAISLHASNQNLRELLIPIAKTNRLSMLMQTLDLYTKKNNKRISYEYILLEKINDDKFHALELAKLLEGRLAHVNLIAYNQVAGFNYKTPSKNRIIFFQQILQKHNISTTIRASLGRDLLGACGQLATKLKRR
jgi:23S rRNA (adenine2503-C2)-methyltransferase